MKTLYTTLLAFTIVTTALRAQNVIALDTLISEPVIGNPISQMLTFPTGFDDNWVNFDEDMLEGFCVQDEETPFGWFIEGDLGFLNPSTTDNEAFTSCSYLVGGERNQNWLILPPIAIPDTSYQLCWRSLPFEGPAFMDGYEVLVSTASNLPSSGDFSHKLFTAAEMIDFVNPNMPTLDPADYVFSDGYIHANGYTDTNYYFRVEPNGPLRGRLEPHAVSLAEFAGQTIYVAFYHNSQDDNQLQLDDIIISRNEHFVAVKTPEFFTDFDILPNPVVGSAYINWTMQEALPGQLKLIDLHGKTMLEKSFGAYERGSLYLELENVPPGMYHCVLETAQGRSVKKLIKG